MSAKKEKGFFKWRPMPTDEGLVVWQPKPAEPSVSLPKPTQVPERAEIRFAKFKGNLILAAKMGSLKEVFEGKIARATNKQLMHFWRGEYQKVVEEEGILLAEIIVQANKLMKENHERTIQIILRSLREGLSRKIVLRLLEHHGDVFNGTL